MTQTLPIALDVGPAQGLSRYLQAINDAPMLSQQEEKDLARRYSEGEDLEAARLLVFSHLRYVASIARGFTGYGLPLADLIQEGNVGLMKAVKRFDHDRDVRLVSFAVHWIKAEIYEYVVRNWRMVKVATTKAQRKLFFNLRKNRNRLGWMKQDEIDAMAEDLNVDTSTVREMEGRMTGADIAFDVDTTDDDESTFWAPSETLSDYSADPGTLTLKADEARVRQQQLDTALDVLDERSRDIIQSRWLAESGKKTTLGDLAEQYGVSAERIRQIEKRALKQMYSAVST
ncbi:MAG TPA: RNA polymerase sigma factor RpoH [Arenicellales bacterium]|jgi:RNA polymerase sigma-32 factor|uniref:RNA polymerase sigma-70 domain-containing protein n=1 Tax=marine metagenome TaxID=408172 RepID=A0A381PJR4_9ZZZZ|nr:RNA polymerase sigma factor RpoH [Arenicellales bacterium]MEC8869931.1 RNA polymerase sigma factor RpoH [Pseudomonadota bacterium]MEC8888547.1 RNA polymerase sigma factor RpoH [Pseudomonadota bacterium]MEC9370287.1 RNA polymerase sigma factor RpoH [Pseudomonadota bacterium]MEE3280109.1 RNA polymerase sigma factor RpoH [Pseudomonadota bacterium]|tara:strand:- start:970 stop:1830 length:861 start_codon:yes stop_codon:yes gene_type:complete